MTRKNIKHTRKRGITIDISSDKTSSDIPTAKQNLKLRSPNKIRRKKMTTIKRKLGKNRNKVYVLIKNNCTRRRIERECQDLKQNKMSDVRMYLKKHNLLKAGSVAPNDVLKATYVDAIKAGEVTNNNPETLIHNYHNGKE